MEVEGMKALFIVANAGFADDVLDVAREAGVRGATILNARGEGARHEMLMGITVDTEKDLILCVVDGKTAESAMAAVKEKLGKKTPAHCVCFTMPVDRTVGIGAAE
jgi:nitrogen regulatory protein PII